MQVGRYELYPYQQRAVIQLREIISGLIAKGLPPHVILQAPCGAGKGVLTAFLAGSCVKKGNRFLFAVHGRSLVSQVSFKFAECGLHHGILMANSTKAIDHEFATHNPKTMHQNPIVVASRDTYESRVMDRKTVQMINPEVIVIDEAHLGHSGNVYQKLLRDNPETVIIGMTATPATGAGYGFGDLYQAILPAVSHRELLEGGFLVPPVCFGPSTVNMSGVDVGENGEYVQDQAAALFDKEELIGDLIRDWKLFSERRPTIVYAQSVAHSIHIAELFNGQGINAEHIDANTPLSKRKQVYKGLADGSVTVATNYGVLRVGVDIPEAGCGVLACGMASLNAYLQSVGRLGRSCKSVFWLGGAPKKDFILIDHGGNLGRHGWPQMERYWTLDPGQTVQEKTAEVEKELPEGKQEMPMAHCNCCGAEWKPDGQSTGCPYCGQTCSRSGSSLCFNGEKLERITEDSAHVNPHQKAWTSCLFIAAQRGMSYGAAVKMFEQKAKIKFRDAVVSPKVAFEQRTEKISKLFPNIKPRKKHVSA